MDDHATPRAERFDAACRQLPLVAILRGLAPEDAPAMGTVLQAEGFALIEVPLNSPRPFESIAALRALLPAATLVGAGTVMQLDDIRQLRDCGADLAVMPHADATLIRAAKAAGLICVPGVATPTEAFGALAAGADALKLFPAEQLSPTVLKAWRAVLPRSVRVLPVGGITPPAMAVWRDAGADGFGLGSALYRPGCSVDELRERARDFVRAWAR